MITPHIEGKRAPPEYVLFGFFELGNVLFLVILAYLSTLSTNTFFCLTNSGIGTDYLRGSTITWLQGIIIK